jgi:hypothetical protein
VMEIGERGQMRGERERNDREKGERKERVR